MQAVDQENSALEQEINNLKTAGLRRTLAGNSAMAIIQRRTLRLRRHHGDGESSAAPDGTP